MLISNFRLLADDPLRDVFPFLDLRALSRLARVRWLFTDAFLKRPFVLRAMEVNLEEGRVTFGGTAGFPLSILLTPPNGLAAIDQLRIVANPAGRLPEVFFMQRAEFLKNLDD